MHKLDILVTHYNEPEYIVTKFLLSLKNQTYRDFKVTIVDDGLDCPELFLDGYDFPIEHLKFEHKTVSKARNNAIENTSAEYFMICDCDDAFCNFNKTGLANAMLKIELTKADVYEPFYYAESWKGKEEILPSICKKEENDNLVYHIKKNSSTIHSKIYKRSFIEKFNLRFLDDLSLNEDGVFNYLAIKFCQFNFGKILDDNTSKPFYIWCYNENSVTRKTGLYPIYGFDQHLKSNTYLFKRDLEVISYIPTVKNNFWKKRLEEYKVKIYDDLMTLLFDSYFWLYLYSDRFIGKDNFLEYLGDDLIALKKFVITCKDYFIKESLEKEKFKTHVKEYLEKIDPDVLKTKKTFEEWRKEYISF